MLKLPLPLLFYALKVKLYLDDAVRFKLNYLI